MITLLNEAWKELITLVNLTFITMVTCSFDSTHLKCRSLNVKCVSTIPVVFTLVLNTSCSVGT